MTMIKVLPIALALAQVAVGGAQAPAKIDLLAVTALDCTFTAGTVGVWSATGEVAPQISATASVTAKYADIDSSIMSARLADGSQDEVAMQVTRTTLNLFESAPDHVTITSVFNQVTKDGRLKAALTRSETVKGPAGDQPTVGQYYGDCAATY
jgi:hypothetical protein